MTKRLSVFMLIYRIISSFCFNVKLFCRKFQVHFCLRFILVYKQLPTCVLYLFILWQKVKQYTLCSPITIRQNKNRKELFTLLHIFVNPTFFLFISYSASFAFISMCLANFYICYWNILLQNFHILMVLYVQPHFSVPNILIIDTICCEY